MFWSGLSRAAVAITGMLLGVTGIARAQPTGVDNRALLDADATATVLGRAKAVSEKLFTYSYAELDAHKRTFAELTTGAFAKKYAEVFGSIEAEVVAQRVTTRGTVNEAAVRTLTGSDAEVLVFLDQSSTRAGTEAGAASGAMFLATLRRVDGEWKMADLNLFGDT